MGLINETVQVMSNQQVGPRLHLMVLDAPAIAADIQPGQFVHMKVPRMEAHILRRPFSICNVNESGELTVIYKVVGAGTEALSRLKSGDECDLLGPLGKPFSRPLDDEVPVLLGGGYGSAAMFMLTKESKTPGVALLGARNSKDILLSAEYRAAGFDVRISTDDGSDGLKGRVTDLLPGVLKDYAGRKLHFYACGPMPMLKALAEYADAHGMEAQISLEERMACGIGACLGCICKTKEKDHHTNVNNTRICKDGPVFDAKEVVFA